MKTHRTPLKVKFNKLLRCVCYLWKVEQGCKDRLPKWRHVESKMSIVYLPHFDWNEHQHLQRGNLSPSSGKKGISSNGRRRGDSMSPDLNMREWLCWFRSKAHLAQRPSTVAVSRWLVRIKKKSVCLITPLSILWLFLLQRISWILDFDLSIW